MGFSKKHQADGDSKEGNKWMIAGITLRAPLKSISTKISNKEDDENSKSGSTTPTSNQSRIPEVLPCPPPPRKRRPVSTCHNNGNMEFFTSPDIDSFFKVFPNSGSSN
ncbi:unnamed protein product [Lactuca virosa]|uniref:Uncharacterized protein n=1 Tax=Lactuca virosa TaxID=75947 RepID=A0AAU9M211_9ASTR|nr:unnamed protein product [Lactuca virosa]